MRLQSQAYGLLMGALIDGIAMDEFGSLAVKLSWRLQDFVSPSSLGERVHAFIQRAEREDSVEALLDAAQEIGYGNQRLAAITYADLAKGGDRAPQSARVSRDLQIRVRDALCGTFAGPDALEKLLSAANRQGAALWNASSPSTSLLLCVAAAAARGWLIDLLVEASKCAPDSVELRTLYGEVSALAISVRHDETWQQALERSQLTGGFFMINRKSLRSSMARMLPERGNRVLVVRGDPRSGMSHSVRLVYHLSEVCGFNVVELDLEESSRRLGPRRNLSPWDFAKDLVDLLKYRDLTLADAPEDKQWSAWNIDFVRSFEERAKNDERQIYLVLDAFHKVRLSQATADLVRSLSASIGMRVPDFRLVLVGYSQDVPVSLRQARLLDETCALTQRDLIEFFAKAYHEADVEIDEMEVVRKALTVLQGRTSAAPGTLEELADRVNLEMPGR